MTRTFVAIAMASVSLAQTPPTFEVASIKPYQGRFPFPVPPALNGPLLNFTAFTVRDLIREAYDLRTDFRINGAAGWMVNDRFDISARAAGEATPTQDEIRPMLQALLAERFSLKFHRETRETAVYALVVAKGGAKLKEHALAESGGPESGGGMRVSCKGAEIVLRFTKAALDLLAQQLTIAGVERPVLNKTGLTGKYDFEYSFAQECSTPTNTAPSGESAFTTLQEKLGLKLEAQKAPIEFLVIDSVQRPSEN